MPAEPLTKTEKLIFGEDAVRDGSSGRIFETGIGSQSIAVQKARFLAEQAAENDRPKEGDSCPYSGRPYDCSVGALPKSIQTEKFFAELPDDVKNEWFAHAEKLAATIPAGKA
jgi:hypothetical protein